MEESVRCNPVYDRGGGTYEVGNHLEIERERERERESEPRVRLGKGSSPFGIGLLQGNIPGHA